MGYQELESLAAVPQESTPRQQPWYAIHVRSKFERIVSTVLREKGFEEFLPLYRAKRQWSDRVKQLDLPLFPGYVFCRIDVGERLLPVVTNPGVLGIVSAGKQPMSVSDLEIEAVRTVLQTASDPLDRIANGFETLAAKPVLGLMHRYQTRLH